MDIKQIPIKEKKHIIIVGPIPPPIGGVTSHIARLAAFLVAHGFRCTVVDKHPSDSKMSIRGVEHIVFSGGGNFRVMLWLLLVIGLGGGNIVHLHFSRSVGLLLFSLFMIKRRRRIILTLHHGDQFAIMKNAIWPLRLLTRIALRRMDKVVALSYEQEFFYRSLGVPVDCIERWPTAIPIGLKPDLSLLPPKIRELLSTMAGREEKILMTSGYPSQFYGYELCVELLDQLSAEIQCNLIICLYGQGPDPDYEKNLRIKLSQHPKIYLLGPLPAEGFLALLSKADLYLRPSTVDSFGLAITDALDMGTPCIASDVCTRDSRCEIFPSGDNDKFIRQAIDLIKKGKISHKKETVDKDDQKNLDLILKCYK